MFSNNVARFKSWGLAVAMLALSGTGQANQLGDLEQSDVASMVGDMLVIDTRIALHNERRRELEAMGIKQQVPMPTPVIQSLPMVTAVDEPANAKQLPDKPKAPVLSVEGIYGPGTQLVADVLIDGQKVRFKAGQRHPIGYDRSFAYQLISINVPCIRVSGPGGSQKLCIDGVQEK